jgi:hypothetical protein
MNNLFLSFICTIIITWIISFFMLICAIITAWTTPFSNFIYLIFVKNKYSFGK